MPKVTFVNEHRSVEIKSGKTISDAAKQLGIPVCREEFIGTGIGDYTVWVKGAEGCVSPPGFFERLRGARGWKRYADKARVLGDVEVWTQGGIGERLRTERKLDLLPNCRADKDAPRKPIDAAGTAAFPYGDPRAIGKGTRAAVARNTGKPKKGAAAAAAEPEADDEAEDSDE
jgi:hypothetical protein